MSKNPEQILRKCVLSDTWYIIFSTITVWEHLVADHETWLRIHEVGRWHDGRVADCIPLTALFAEMRITCPIEDPWNLLVFQDLADSTGKTINLYLRSGNIYHGSFLRAAHCSLPRRPRSPYRS